MAASTELAPPPRPQRSDRRLPLAAWIAGGVFAVLVIVALAVAAAAAAAIGLIALAAALVLRLAPKPRDSSTPLEARRTAEGWVVEAASPR